MDRATKSSPMQYRMGVGCWKKSSAATGRNGSHFTPLLQSRRARTQNGFSSCKYHCTNFSPKNIHVSAPKARYGPNGNFADQTLFPMSKVASPTTEPTTEPAKMLNKPQRHPRKAPIAPRNV